MPVPNFREMPIEKPNYLLLLPQITSDNGNDYSIEHYANIMKNTYIPRSMAGLNALFAKIGLQNEASRINFIVEQHELNGLSNVSFSFVLSGKFLRPKVNGEYSINPNALYSIKFFRSEVVGDSYIGLLSMLRQEKGILGKRVIKDLSKDIQSMNPFASLQEEGDLPMDIDPAPVAPANPVEFSADSAINNPLELALISAADVPRKNFDEQIYSMLSWKGKDFSFPKESFHTTEVEMTPALYFKILNSFYSYGKFCITAVMDFMECLNYVMDNNLPNDSVISRKYVDPSKNLQSVFQVVGSNPVANNDCLSTALDIIDVIFTNNATETGDFLELLPQLFAFITVPKLQTLLDAAYDVHEKTGKNKKDQYSYVVNSKSLLVDILPLFAGKKTTKHEQGIDCYNSNHSYIIFQLA